MRDWPIADFGAAQVNNVSPRASTLAPRGWDPSRPACLSPLRAGVITNIESESSRNAVSVFAPVRGFGVRRVAAPELVA